MIFELQARDVNIIWCVDGLINSNIAYSILVVCWIDWFSGLVKVSMEGLKDWESKSKVSVQKDNHILTMCGHFPRMRMSSLESM